jgi:hypothetical protein
MGFELVGRTEHHSNQESGLLDRLLASRQMLKILERLLLLSGLAADLGAAPAGRAAKG